MADNTRLPTATTVGDLVATDDIGAGVAAGAKVQRIKVGFGADGSYTDVEASAPLPVAGAVTVAGVATAANQATELASLASIDGKVATSAAQTTAQASLTTIAAAQDVATSTRASEATAAATLALLQDVGEGNIAWASQDIGVAACRAQPGDDVGADATSNMLLVGTTDTAGIARRLVAGAHGGLGVEGVAGGVPVPVSVATLPALTAGSAVIGHVVVDSASSVSITSLPAIPTGSNTIGKVDQGTGGASAWKVDGSAVTQPVSSSALTSIDGKTPALGQALAAASSPVVLPTAQDVVAYAGAAGSLKIVDGGASLTVDAPVGSPVFVRLSDGSTAIATLPVATRDSAPSGAAWTTDVGVQIAKTAAGTAVVAAATGQTLRSVTVTNPTNTVALFYFVWHGAAPSWSGSGLTVIGGQLIACGQLGAASNLANILQDYPGGLAVPNGVFVVVGTVSGATTNLSYVAPTSFVFATVRYGV